MKKLLLAAAMVLVVAMTAANAEDNVFHYACKRGDKRYAITVNPDEGIVKMQDQAPPHNLKTFRIAKDVIPACGRGGWQLNEGAVFCYYTQGVADLTWHGREFKCDQANTE